MKIATEQKLRIKKQKILRLQLEKGEEFNLKVGEQVYFDDEFLSKEDPSLRIEVKIPKNLKNLEKMLKVVDGELVEKGDVLIDVPKGLMGLSLDEIKSDVKGVVDLSDISKGKIYIKSLNRAKYSYCGVNGEIKKIVPAQYAELKSDFIRILPFKIISESDIKANLACIKGKLDKSVAKYIVPEHKGKVVFIDTLVPPDAFVKADVIGVSAIICPGIDVDQFEIEFGSFDLNKLRQKLKIGVVILESFGKFETYAKVSKVFFENVGMFLYISKNTLDICVKGLHAKASEDLEFFSELKVGDEIKLLYEEQFGEYGLVEKINEKNNTLDVTLDKKIHLKNVSCLNIVKIII